MLPQDASVDSADKAFGVWVTVTSSSVVEVRVECWALMSTQHAMALTREEQPHARFIQALWSSFYATGDTKYLERVVELALPWLEHELEVGFQRLVEPNMDMPDSLSGTACLIRRKEHGAVPRF